MGEVGGDGNIFLETAGRSNGMWNCGRVDREVENDWTVNEIKVMKKERNQANENIDILSLSGAMH